MLPRNKFESLPTKSNASDSRFCLFVLNSYDPSFVEFFCFAQQSNSSNAAISNFLDVSAVPLCEWFENYSGVSLNAGFTTGERGRGSGLTCPCDRVVDIHDSIKLLNFVDDPGFYMETLPCPCLMQLLENARGVAHVVRALLSRSPVSPRINLRSTFLSARIGNSFDSVKWIFALIQNQNCCVTPKCELCWRFNVTPLFG